MRKGVPGHSCVGDRVRINLELTDTGSRRVCCPRGVLKEAHPSAGRCRWIGGWLWLIVRRVGGDGEKF